MRKNIIPVILPLFITVMISSAFVVESKEIKIPVSSDQVTVVTSLPSEKKGSDVVRFPTFNRFAGKVKDHVLFLDVSSEPVWIVEGAFPTTPQLKPENSPFGFLPAAVDDSDYSYALDIGVAWERGGIFPFFWSLVQTDPQVPVYNWQVYDRYFQHLPKSLCLIKNISVTRFPKGGMGRRPMLQDRSENRPDLNSGRRPPRELENRNASPGSMRTSQFSAAHVEGESYRPSFTDMYLRWVKATVERYDGDGKNDMPGLKNPVRYWQIDNEPENHRPGFGDLVHMTSRAIKEADPQAKVILGGLFLPVERAKRRYELSQLSLLADLKREDIDIIDLHWFGCGGEWRELGEKLHRVKSDLARYGMKDIPIYMTEVGTYSGHPDGPKAFPYPYQTENDQAVEMLKRHVMALSEGVGKVFWAWGMMEGFGNVYDNDFFDNTGFIYDGIGVDDPGRGVKKITYWTYRNMTGLLKYWDGSPLEKIDIAKDVHAFRFKFNHNDKRGIIMVWSD